MQAEPNQPPPAAWQPFTARGVAAFAQARLGRLLTVQFLFALLVAASVAWFLHHAWVPVLDDTVNRLPDQSEIRAGVLDWRAASPVLLAENRFLAVAVDLDHTGQVRSPAHLCLELGRHDLRVYSLLGYLPVSYPTRLWISLNRPAALPWWGAWMPVLLALSAALTILVLFLAWAVLATLYTLPVWLVGFYANRQLGLRASWRLAGAALMPGALFMALMILLHGLGAVDPLRLILALAAHLLIGWVYLWMSPLRVPHIPGADLSHSNPFATPGTT
ncbi:MAG TPA: hypothetical protein P5038_10295 [Candidatus Paceibacterota bacterium]|nr:hypothetical protein [Candidatus Paceibacterota bacterium]